MTSLNCSNNQLTALDLTPVSRVTSLNCSNNQLTTLDLTPVSGLTSINCSNNQLKSLRLPAGQGLTDLNCSNNQLTALDLTPVSALTSLDCSNNRLTSLDFTPVSGLRNLHYSHNQFVALDLSPVSWLSHLDFNSITEIDLSSNSTNRNIIMYTSKIATYAVWVSILDSRKQKIEDGFHALWNSTLKNYNLVSNDGSPTSEFKPWIKLGEDFYFLHVESHWSPGDICGYIKNAVLDRDDSIVAVRIDQTWYIPDQGLADKKIGGQLSGWKSQAEKYHLVSNSS